MPQPHPNPMDRWRVIIPHRDLSRILVVAEPDRPGLPEVSIPRNQRVAWHLNAEVKRNWNLDVISIVPVETGSSLGRDAIVQYHLLQPLGENTAVPCGLEWTSMKALTRELLPDEEDHRALSAFLATGSRLANTVAPFERTGWFDQLTEWLREVLTPFSLDWDGGFTQFQAGDSFSLIRFKTKPLPVWFKAVGDPNTREFRITQELARRFPDFLPRLLALRPDWNGWVALECPGRPLAEIREIEMWCVAARTLAELQIQSVAGRSELLGAGAHDLDSYFSLSAIDRFFATAERFLEPTDDRAAAGLLQSDFPEMKSKVREFFARTQRFPVPNALGHLDLNAGNAIVSSKQCWFLDWAEACIGPPFLSFDYLLQSFRRLFGRHSPEEQPVVRSYLTAWERLASPSDVGEVWTVSPALAVFAYAQRCLIAAEPYGPGASRFTGYLASLLRRLKREVQKSQELKAGAR